MYNTKDNILNVNFDNKLKYGKTKFDKNYWDEQRALGTMERAEKHENAKQCWDRITKGSPIRMIQVDIAGSGDSGGIDEIRLYDENQNLIIPKYQIGTLLIPTETYYNSDEEDATKIVKPFTKYWTANQDKFDTREAALECLSKYYVENNILNATPSYKDDVIYCTEYELVRDNIGTQDTNQEWKHWNDNANRQYELEFPKINKSLFYSDRNKSHPLVELYDYTYRLLPGGWEINEGSTSKITFYNDKALENGVSDSSFKVSVDFTQFEYAENNESWEINSQDDMYKIVREFIKDNKIKHHTINLKNKRHNELFYKLSKKLGNAMYNENITID